MNDADKLIEQNTEKAIKIKELSESISLAREALQACDNFLDYSHSGTGNQSLAYRYVKGLIKKWLESN